MFINSKESLELIPIFQGWIKKNSDIQIFPNSPTPHPQPRPLSHPQN